jgi:nucleotide-binding universal stress UspA family protein
VTGAVLLAHHGTAGAGRAARLALERAVERGAGLVHLLVVPDFWGGMQGDDWLNNASTRDAFARYLEGMLEREAREQLAAIEADCVARGLAYTPILRYGDPTDCLIEAAGRTRPDWVVIGAPRPKGVAGYRSRIDVAKLLRVLCAPLLVAAPHPAAAHA